MENHYCYVAFEINDAEKFSDLQRVFGFIKAAKNNSEPKEDAFWLSVFPKYFIENFCFDETDLKPDYKTISEGEFHWFFYGLIELLTVDYEIEYISCKETGQGTGSIVYDTYSYPYGGILGLLTLVKHFHCLPTLVDDGAGLYKIELLPNGDFDVTEFEQPKPEEDSKTALYKNSFLQKLIRRLKN